MASDTIYDHPHCYDVLFGFDRSIEADFYHRTFARCGVAAGAPVLEVAAGPARVGRLLARRGFSVTALDRSAAMLAYAEAAASKEAAPLATLCAAMEAFQVPRPFAAAFNPLSSFRLLLRDADVDAHLRCMAAALAPHGVYVLDLAFHAREGEEDLTTDEAWEMSRDGVTVRGENAGVTVCDADGERRLGWGQEGHLRGYTVGAFVARVGACAALTIESWHPADGRAGDVSTFSLAGSERPPTEGRAMVVLRRR